MLFSALQKRLEAGLEVSQSVVEHPGGGAEIFCTTVHSFKGLERSVVILAELAHHDINNLQTLLYVGSTRACNHFIIFGTPELISDEGVAFSE